MSTPTDDTRRLREMIQKWRDAAAWEHDDMSNAQSAQTFDQCANELEATLEAAAVTPEGRQEQEPLKPLQQYHNRKFSGQGFGSAGPYRIVVRTDRKTIQPFVEILHDDDAGGVSFTKRQAMALIPCLQAAVDSLRSATAVTPEGRLDCIEGADMSGLVIYPLQLGGSDRWCELRVPAQLLADDVRRITAMLSTLVIVQAGAEGQQTPETPKD